MTPEWAERLAEEWRRRAEERGEEGALLDAESVYMKVAREMEAAAREHWNEELTVSEAAEWSGYHEDTIREAVRDGRIPDTRPPGSQGRIRVKRKHLRRKPPEVEPRDLDVVESLEEDLR